MISGTVTNYIVDKFIELEIINQEDKEIYYYSYQYIIELLFFCFSLIILSIPLNMLTSTILFIITVIPLRTFAGGIHASTRQACSLLSYTVYIVCIYIPHFMIELPYVIILILLFVSLILICIYSPQPDRKKKLSSKDIYRLKRLTIIIALLIIFMNVIFYIFNMKSYIACCTCDVLFILSGMLLQLIKNKLANGEEQ